jgi:hypothetical protein
VNHPIPPSRGQRIVAYINYTLVSIVLFGLAFVGMQVIAAFASGRVDQILRGAR